MNHIATFVTRRRIAILLFWTLLVVLSVLVAGRIEVVTEARQMLPQDNPRVETFNNINERFTTANFLVTVEGADRSRMIDAAGETAERIRDSEKLDGLVDSVSLRVDADFAHSWGLMLQEESQLRKSLRLLEADSFTSFFRTFNDNLEETYTGDEGRDEVDSAREEIETAQFLSTIERSMTLLREAVAHPGNYPADETGSRLAEMLLLGDPYSFDWQNRMLVFGVQPTFSVTALDESMTLTGTVSEILADVGAEYPQLQLGYAGDIAQNYDEQRAVGSDLFWPTLVALLLILVLFVFSFIRTRGVVFVLISLAVGIVSTVAYIALVLGEINLITSSFAVLLMGLGVDFGIHFLANYDTFRAQGAGISEAIAQTYRKVGTAIVLGALATAVAFFSLLLTETEVMHQFALVAGGGIAIALVAVLTLLPALLALFGRRTEAGRRLPVFGFDWIGRTGLFCARHRWIVLAVSLVLAVGSALVIPKNTFLYDLTELGPQEATSVVTQRRIEERMGFSPLPMMVSYDDMKEVRATTEQLENERMVASLSSLSQYIPADREQQERLDLIREARAAWTQPTSRALGAADLEELTYEIQRLEWNMIEIGDLAVTALGEGNLIQRQRDAMIHEVLGAEVGKPGEEVFQKLIAEIAATPERSIRRLNEIQAHFVAAIADRARSLLSPDRPIRADDLPEAVTDQTISDDGEYYLVTAVPSAEVRNQEAFFRFRDRMLAVDHDMTGTIPIAIEFSESLTEEVGHATLYIAAALLVILLLTFRRLTVTGLVVFGMVVSVLVMFGLFPLLGISMNVVNMMALPLIFGLGIDYFIHVTHRFNSEGALEPALRLTGKGVLLSAATTMLAFGSLGAIGQYHAIQLLGQMLFVGIGVVLIMALTLLPALLSWLPNEAQNAPADHEQNESNSSPEVSR